MDRRTPFLLAFAIAAGLPALAAADGEYWGVDIAESTSGGVLSATRGALTFGAGYTDYGDGVSAGLSLSRTLSYDLGIEGLQLGAGAAVGFGGDDLSDVSLGLTLSAQRWRPAPFGSTFLQANYNTIDRAYFMQAQATFDRPGLTVALSDGGSTEYHETTLSLSERLGRSPVSLRAGWRFEAREWFVGFSVNTF